MNTKQLQHSRNWGKVRAQVLKYGVLVSVHNTVDSLECYQGKQRIVTAYSCCDETYHYLGLRWDFTVVTKDFEIASHYVTYQAGEITRIGWAPQPI